MTSKECKVNYYVYTHEDPESGEVFYVGIGTYDRPYDIAKARKKEHKEMLVGLCDKGFLMSDVVNVILTTTDKELAKDQERGSISSLRPRFNKSNNPSYAKSQYEKKYDMSYMKELKDEGHSFVQVAEKMNLTTMTVWRALQYV